MSLPLFGSQGCHFSISPLLFILSCPCFCLILFCFWPILLTSFFLNLHFPNGRRFCVAHSSQHLRTFFAIFFTIAISKGLLPRSLPLDVYASGSHERRRLLHGHKVTIQGVSSGRAASLGMSWSWQSWGMCAVSHVVCVCPILILL